MSGPHQPDRRTWLCITCGEEFPCEPACEFFGDWGEPARSVVMSGYFLQAAYDLPRAIDDGLYVRFMRWY